MRSYYGSCEKLKALAEGDIFSSSTMSGLFCNPHFCLTDVCALVCWDALLYHTDATDG